MKNFMKIALLMLLFFNISFLSFGQAPNQFKYQAIIRDASANILANENVTVDISILKGSTNGSTVFNETHSVITNAQGLINLNIGSIEDLSVIEWSTDNYFIEITVNGTILGTSQLLSVPYALQAKEVENIDYSQITNTPTLFDGDYNSLSNLPTLFDGDYNSLINLPTLFDGDWNNLSGTPPNISVFNNDEGYIKNCSECAVIYTSSQSYAIELQSASNVIKGILYENGSGTYLPMAGMLTVTTKIFSESAGGTALWSETIDIEINDGHFWYSIGQQAPVPSSLLEEPNLWYEFDISGEPFATRIKMTRSLDESDSNELQDLTLNGTTLEITNGTSVDLSSLQDGVGDGSETKITAGTNITITGSGTTGNPYVVNATDGNSSNDFYLGQDTLGGIVFYIYLDRNGDQHGLIVSKTETAAQWQSTTSTTNATRSWDGEYNMSLMINSPAKTWVESLGSEWYLPSVDELVILYNNRFHVNKALNDAGETIFGNTNNYWSSTEFGGGSAWRFEFQYGYSDISDKDLGAFVRAVRAF
jgi:hypothetical protein